MQPRCSEAMQLERLGRVPEAIAAYERVLARTPQLPDCWYNLARLQRRSALYPAALASPTRRPSRTASTDPRRSHLNRGVIYSD